MTDDAKIEEVFWSELKDKPLRHAGRGRHA